MVWTALVTPYQEDGDINYDEFARLLEDQHRAGVDGVLVLGTTGEAPSLSNEEKITLYEFAVKNAPKGLRLMAGTGTNNLNRTAYWTSRVMDMGYEMALVVVPYYLKTSQEGLYRYFETLVSMTDARIMLYNVPTRTGTNMLPDTVLRLARIDNVVGIKEASGSDDAISEIVGKAPEDFLVLSGDDSKTLPFLALGAHGVVSVASNIFPDLVVKMVKGKDRRIHQLLFPLFKALFVEPNPIPVRWAMKLMGYTMGPYRLPLVEPIDSTKDLLVQVLHEIKTQRDAFSPL
ncbi:MAG: 4-hydroxy-tetrahydrodipicolinate synthase [Thermotogae bacterium]|nr:4-hydroxy-tetrahydrodipicolinate synthase [Thermotogota bacterium]